MEGGRVHDFSERWRLGCRQPFLIANPRAALSFHCLERFPTSYQKASPDASSASRPKDLNIAQQFARLAAGQNKSEKKTDSKFQKKKKPPKTAAAQPTAFQDGHADTSDHSDRDDFDNDNDWFDDGGDDASYLKDHGGERNNDDDDDDDDDLTHALLASLAEFAECPTEEGLEQLHPPASSSVHEEDVSFMDELWNSEPGPSSSSSSRAPAAVPPQSQAEPASSSAEPKASRAPRATSGVRIMDSNEFHLPQGGVLRYYPHNKTVSAICDNPMHDDCRLSRTCVAPVALPASKKAKGHGQGRPLGMLTAWLLNCMDHTSQRDHNHDCRPTFQERRKAREYLKGAPGGANFSLLVERPKRSGEDSEPEFIR